MYYVPGGKSGPAPKPPAPPPPPKDVKPKDPPKPEPKEVPPDPEPETDEKPKDPKPKDPEEDPKTDEPKDKNKDDEKVDPKGNDPKKPDVVKPDEKKEETDEEKPEEKKEEKPDVKHCDAKLMVLEKEGMKYKPKATDPKKTAWMTVSPKASDTFTMGFDSDTWSSIKKFASKDAEIDEKFKDYRKDPVAAKKKWKEEAEDKTGKNMFSFKIQVAEHRLTDFAEVKIESEFECENKIEKHKIETTSPGLSPNAGLEEGTKPGTWVLKCKPPKERGPDIQPRVYTVRLPECAPSQDALLAKICVFPARLELLEFTFHPKKFNEMSKKLSTTLKMFGDRLKFEVEIGKFFLAGSQGWIEDSSGSMYYTREITGGAKPVAKAELKLKISFLECCTGIPAECWDWICDVGAQFAIGGSIDASLGYAYKKKYGGGPSHEITGKVVGKLYAEIGLYAKVGPKGLAEVSVEAGAKFGITASGTMKMVSTEGLGADASLDIEPVKLEVTVKTKFLWVFGSEHPSEWELTEKKNIWKDQWSLIKFDTPAA